MEYKPVAEGNEPAATTTTTTTSTSQGAALSKEPEFPPQPQTTTTTTVVKKEVFVVDFDPIAHPATTICDGLYITSVFLSAFASALSFPGVWNSTFHYDQVASSYVAFAYLFLFFTWPQTIHLIAGLTYLPVERAAALQKSLFLTSWNIILLIIAIATEWTSVEAAKEPTNLALVMAGACLLSAIVVETALLSCQIAAHVITSKNDPVTLAVYLPLTHGKAIARDLLIGNAILSVVVLAFGVADLIYLAPIVDPALGGVYEAGAAFAVIFFFTALIGSVVSIAALIPTAVPTAVLLLASWLFSFFTFIVALTAFFLQLFSQDAAVPDQFLIPLLGWIFALGTLCVGVATFCVLDHRVCLPTRPNVTLLQAKELAEIEKYRLEAIQHRKERERLEYGHSAAQV